MLTSVNFSSDITTIHQKHNLNEDFSFNKSKPTACQMPVRKVVFKALLKTLSVTATVIQAVFFYLKFLSSMALSLGLIHLSEFAVRLISRAKPSNRTNKANRTMSVVETLSPPIQAVRFFKNFTKTLNTMIYQFKFKAISRRDLGNTRKPINQMTVYTLKTTAESEEKARALFAPYYVILNAHNAKGGIYA